MLSTHLELTNIWSLSLQQHEVDKLYKVEHKAVVSTSEQ